MLIFVIFHDIQVRLLSYLCIRIFPIDFLSSSLLSIYSWWCSLFNADLALSIAMTSVSSVLSIAFLPLNLMLYVRLFYGSSVDIQWGKFFLSVGITVAAVVAGAVVSYKIPQHRKHFNLAGQIAGVALILNSILFGAACGDSSWTGEPVLSYIGIAFPCVVGITLPLAICFILGRRGVELPWPERTAICVESAYQNIGIAQAFAISVLEADDSVQAIKVPLFYGLAEVVTILIFLVISWKCGCTHAPANDPLWRVLSTSYQEGQEGIAIKSTAISAENELPDLQSGKLSTSSDLT